MATRVGQVDSVMGRRARTGEGHARAEANGVKMGRRRKLTDHQRREAMNVLNYGTASQVDLALRFNVSQATISRFAP
jgi:hypothetical protein